MSLFTQIVALCGGLSTIFAAAVILIAPLREHVLGTKQSKDGQKCLLRSDMLQTYYRHRAKDSIRQYELENFILEYKAYKALGGNSFIDRIYEEVKTWEVVA